MTCLVYAIMRTPPVDGEPLAGVAGSTIRFVATPDLAAAMSELPAVAAAPSVPDLLAYGKVVESLHRRQAVIPMRYGCFLDDVAAVQRLLTERQDSYAALLGVLQDRVEMGIRVLVPAAAGVPSPPALPPAVGGSQYLAQRRALYRERDDSSQQHHAVLGRYREAFAELRGQVRTETAARDGVVVLSLYFLIAASQVGQFRESFRRLPASAAARALVSGPWPPYNFVTPEA